MFIENGDKRYRSFYKQFNKLPLDEQLAALTFIIFAYSEEVYLSNSIISVISLCSLTARNGYEVIFQLQQH